MIDSDVNSPAIPTATLREILDNDGNISKEARLNRNKRDNIALYLRAFHLDAEVLDEKYDFGVEAVRAIQNSCTYQSFVCAVEGKKYRYNAVADVHSLDFKIGYETGIKVSNLRRRA